MWMTRPTRGRYRDEAKEDEEYVQQPSNLRSHSVARAEMLRMGP